MKKSFHSETMRKLIVKEKPTYTNRMLIPPEQPMKILGIYQSIARKHEQ